MDQPYLGEISIFAGNFPPLGWKFCDGQLLAISENDALFALIGTTYGGDGVTTFALPDLRGRVPIHQGSYAGRTFILGQSSGTESVTLLTNNLPMHNHSVNGDISFKTRGDSAGNFAAPDDHYIAQAPLKKFFGRTVTTDKMAPLTCSGIIGPAGNSMPHDNMQPYLALHFIIAEYGVFPSRN